VLIRLNDQDKSSLYQQIAASVHRALADGELGAGDRLPTARALAEELGINMHTVLRGYTEVEREGLVQMPRSRGVIVYRDGAGRARLYQLVRQPTDEAIHLGVG
jgi:DNA-binding transcriptional regulator YhcF (GntR family)